MTKKPKLVELEDWLTTGQVATRLGRSRQGVLNLARDGRFRAVHVGKNHERGGERGVWIYDPESVDEFAKEAYFEEASRHTKLWQEANVAALIAYKEALSNGATGEDAMRPAREAWHRVSAGWTEQQRAYYFEAMEQARRKQDQEEAAEREDEDDILWWHGPSEEE